jgi:hypothetical protein
MKLRFWRASYLVWLVVPPLAYGIFVLYGLPHVIWSYSFHGGEQGFGSRYYTRCTFIGPYGEFTVAASGGSCGWVNFFKRKDAVQ